MSRLNLNFKGGATAYKISGKPGSGSNIALSLNDTNL